MRYLPKYLQRAGLVSTLLIGGVLGGLMAPPPSEASAPLLRLQIDGLALQSTTNGTNFTNVTNNSILGSAMTACPAADAGLNYTTCYSIVTSTTTAYRANNNRLYRIQSISSSNPARLRVGDNAGLDNLSIAGVKFVPVNTANQSTSASVLTNWGNVSTTTPAFANTNESHQLVFTIGFTFDGSVNSVNAGSLPVGMRTGGQLQAGPISTPVPTSTLYCGTTASPAKCNAVNDSIVYSARGAFSSTLTNQAILRPSGANSTALSLTVGSASAGQSIVSFGNLPYANNNMSFVDPTYPSFVCQSTIAGRSAACTETVTQTMTVTLKGPDTFVATGTDDIAMAPCATPVNAHLSKLVSWIKKAVAFLDIWERSHPNQKLRDLITEVQALLLTADVPSDPLCPGATLVRWSLILHGVRDAIQNTAVGAVQADIAPPETGTITITKNSNSGETDAIFNFNISGPSPSTPSISMEGMTNRSTDAFSVPAGDYSVTEIDLPANWSEVGTSTCYDGESTFPATEVSVPSGGNVTCTFNNIHTPVVQTGTIVIEKNAEEFGYPVAETFGFTGTGQGITDFSITTQDNGNNSHTFTGLATGAGSRTFTETSFPVIPPPSDNFWFLSSVICSSALNPSTDFWEPVYSGPFESLSGVRVITLVAGDVVRCNFNNGVHSP